MKRNMTYAMTAMTLAMAIAAAFSAGPAGAQGSRPDEETVRQAIERTMIMLALERAGGNRSKAAELLGITRRTLYSRMDRYGIGNRGSSAEE